MGASVFTKPKFSPQERAFILRYAMSNREDPLGAYLAAFKPGGDWEQESMGPKLAALIGREDIQLETYVWWRLRQDRSGGSFLHELEEARVKALSECNGALTAANIAVFKAQALNLLPAAGAAGVADQQPAPRPGRTVLAQDAAGQAFMQIPVPGSAEIH